MSIRAVTPGDAAAICAIYNHYVLDTTVTFEEETVNIPDMQQRIAAVTQNHPWIVYVDNDMVVGYAYASAWKTRSAYRYTVESTIYVLPAKTGKGIGKTLYTRLLRQLKEQGIHAVIGGIALPNDASIKLHEALGFKKAGEFSEVGLKFGMQVNVGYWQLIF